MIAAFDVASIRAGEQAHGIDLESGVLMDRAATGLARTIIAILQELRGQIRGARIAIAVGGGNNGGDALFAGAKLAQRGALVTAVCIGATAHEAGVATLRRANGRVVQWQETQSVLAQQELFLDADIIIDGIVGIGGAGALRPAAAAVVELINSSGALVVAVDLPSGVAADTGEVAELAVAADITVTFGCLKPGLLIAPGSFFAGGVHVVDIGITDALVEPTLIALEALDVVAYVPKPDFNDYKYRRGVVGVAAGGRQYPGAALLAVGAARMGDVGMVRYLDRGDDVAGQVLAAFPDVVASGEDPGSATRVTAWACGPGFEPQDVLAVEAVLRTEVPVVLDAGALMAVASSAPLRTAVAARAGITVITPHPGEAAALAAALSLPEDLGRLDLAKALAERLRLVVVLKGPATLIAAPGGLVLVDTMGGAELSTAGSGDVLTGLAAAILAGASARGDVEDLDDAAVAAAAAVWLHGQAGQLAAAGGRPVTAVDVREHLAGAVALVRR
ncbi:bifunctional NAD(P)H-hydrate repair enzyme [Actinomycetes bacterium]|nr:bifunctional NAD(P)H-hydrate repair enzyme [Actinomycetes bacterium]